MPGFHRWNWESGSLETMEGVWTDTVDHTSRMIDLVRIFSKHPSPIKDYRVLPIIKQFMMMDCSDLFATSSSEEDWKRQCQILTCPHVHFLPDISLFKSCLPYKYCHRSACYQCENETCVCSQCRQIKQKTLLHEINHWEKEKKIYVDRLLTCKQFQFQEYQDCLTSITRQLSIYLSQYKQLFPDKPEHHSSVPDDPVKPECCICFNPVSHRVVCIPCGHMNFCFKCIHTLDSCPICRSQIKEKIQVYG